MVRNQVQDAQYLYDERSVRYDDSWHPRFARHIVELVHPQPGERVLDLACGTGLVSFPASEAVGPPGKVVGIDISSGMLAQAQQKKTQQSQANVEFFQHSITDLPSLESIQGQKFNVITCASALVLLEHPAKALKQWASYLTPGGRLITDVTHPRSQLAHITLERVGKVLNLPVPSYRLPFQSSEDLIAIMKNAGLGGIKVELMSQMQAKDDRQDLAVYIHDPKEPTIERTYTAGDAGAIFDNIIDTKYAEVLAGKVLRSKAKELFLQEWDKLVDENGNIHEIDGVFVGIGKRQ